MKPTFPLDDVILKQVDKPAKVTNPAYSNSWLAISENEFFMDVQDVGRFYARNGSYIEYSANDSVSIASIELYLNGSVYGAILHQRKIMPLHGSSFVYKTLGVMLCGDSGAGKSSLTVSFCDEDADFLTDDVSPVVLMDGMPCILSKSDRVKLWDDSLKQLNKKNTDLAKIRPQDEKFYLSISDGSHPSHSLDLIFILEKYDQPDVTFEPVSGSAAFSAIHDQIYRLYYLHAMPNVLKSYFGTVAAVSNQCKLVKVKRPADIPIKRMKAELESYIHDLTDMS